MPEGRQAVKKLVESRLEEGAITCYSRQTPRGAHPQVENGCFTSSHQFTHHADNRHTAASSSRLAALPRWHHARPPKFGRKPAGLETSR